jgi:hypothetical protein
MHRAPDLLTFIKKRSEIMNTFKKKFLTISITLIVLLLNGYGVTYSQPRSGDWKVPTEFGEFVFTVNVDGTQITKLVTTFTDWQCGVVIKSGTIISQTDPPWPISDDQFTIEISISPPPGDDIMTYNGTFTQTGDEASGTWSAVVSDSVCSGDWEVAFVDVEELANSIPTRFKMTQNYPNPFNSATTISYHVSEITDIELTIFNILGQKIRTLVNCRQSAGSYQIQWDGQDNEGRNVASGIYFYRLKAGEFAKIRKMVLIK